MYPNMSGYEALLAELATSEVETRFFLPALEGVERSYAEEAAQVE
jgi:hypothetical protein